ncbi:MAG: thermonuclease family protein [Acidobacteria bacterium]|nr:thermonuclease family protein [Acidobacteriota bacterium]
MFARRGEVRDIGRYKRTVAEIILPDGRNLNQEVVRAGLAWWYRTYAKHDAVLPALEDEARAAKRGLWADPSPMPPWEWRRCACATRETFTVRIPSPLIRPPGQAPNTDSSRR